jgi:hypothetical protein
MEEKQRQADWSAGYVAGARDILDLMLGYVTARDHERALRDWAAVAVGGLSRYPEEMERGRDGAGVRGTALRATDRTGGSAKPSA